MIAPRSVRVRNLPEGHVRVDLDNGMTVVGVEMSWRLALRTGVRLLAVASVCAMGEGLSESQFDVLLDAETDQVAAEIRGAR